MIKLVLIVGCLLIVAAVVLCFRQPSDPLKSAVDAEMRNVRKICKNFNSLLKGWAETEDRLGKLPREARPHLIPYLNDRNPWVRRCAASALGFHFDDQVFELLLAEIRKKDPDSQSWMIYVVAKSGHPRALESLVPLLGEMDKYGKERLYQELREMKSPGAGEIVAANLDKEKTLDLLRVRVKILAELGALSKATPFWEHLSKEQKLWILEAMPDDMDAQGRLDVLLAALSDESEDILLKALQSMGPLDFKTDRLCPVLEKLRRHPSGRLSGFAANYLEATDQWRKEIPTWPVLAGIPLEHGLREGALRQALFNGAAGLAMAHDGALLAVDMGNDRLRRIGPEGVSTVPGSLSEDSGWSKPECVLVLPDHSLLIARGSRVMRLKDGTTELWMDLMQTIVGSPAHITAMVLSPGGELYVCDRMNKRIYKREDNGKPTMMCATEKEPYSMAFHPEGFLVIGEYGRILALSREGKLEVYHQADWENEEPLGEFLTAMAFDHKGRLFIANGEHGLVVLEKGKKAIPVKGLEMSLGGLVLDGEAAIYASSSSVIFKIPMPK